MAGMGRAAVRDHAPRTGGLFHYATLAADDRALTGADADRAWRHLSRLYRSLGRRPALLSADQADPGHPRADCRAVARAATASRERHPLAAVRWNGAGCRPR